MMQDPKAVLPSDRLLSYQLTPDLKIGVKYNPESYKPLVLTVGSKSIALDFAQLKHLEAVCYTLSRWGKAKKMKYRWITKTPTVRRWDKDMIWFMGRMERAFHEKRETLED